MLKQYFKLISIFLIFSLKISAMEKFKADTLRGYFLYYSSKIVNIDHVITYDIIIPLKANSRQSVTDSFNFLVAEKDKMLYFLNNSPKIFPSLDYSDMNYLIKKYKLDSLQEEKTYAAFLFLNKEKESYQLNRYDSKYKNMEVSIVLFEAEIEVVNLDKDFMQKNCCDFHVKDNIIFYPDNFYNINCMGPVLISLKILKN